MCCINDIQLCYFASHCYAHVILVVNRQTFLSQAQKGIMPKDTNRNIFWFTCITKHRLMFDR